MHAPPAALAWLEAEGGNRWPVTATCSIGRSRSNQVVFPSPEVSRRHALIHVQERDEFWLVDLGTINGTYLNERRVVQPTRLRDWDRIRVGQHGLTFRQPTGALALREETSESKPTLPITQTVNCWLLVADIVESQKELQSRPLETLAQQWGGWFSDCKNIVQRHGGAINKYLGDGFLAYWHERTDAADAVARTLKALKQVQERPAPRFLLAVHFGQVGIGGVASMGEESLLGEEVYFVFRVEELAKQLRELRLVSQPAGALLEGHLDLAPLGPQALHGFKEPQPMHTF